MEGYGGGGMRCVEIAEEQGFLCGCPLECGEECVELLLRGVGSAKAHVGFGAWLERLRKAFAHTHRFECHEPAGGGEQTPRTEFALHGFQAACLLRGEGVVELALAGGERMGFVFAEVGIAHEEGFAFEFESGGECGFHHFSSGTHVVVGHPFPQVELRNGHHGHFVDHFAHFLQLYVGFGAYGVECHGNGRVEPSFA